MGHILRRNCLLKHITKGKIGDRRQVKGRRPLLDGLKETGRYCNIGNFIFE